MNQIEEISVIKEKFGIVGREREVGIALSTLRAGKHLMIEGPVGVGKTILANAVARYLGARVIRIDGDERYTEQKLSGWFDPPIVLEKGYIEDAFISGPLTEAMREGAILFINELNRMPEGVQNILLPSMDEGTIEIPKIGTVSAAPGFVIVATQNPREFVATTSLSEALSDRFELLLLGYQSEEEEAGIVARRYPSASKDLVASSVWIARRTRTHPDIRRGASVRAAMSICELSGHLSDDLQDGVRKAAHISIPTRIEMREESSSSVDEIIDGIVSECFSQPRTSPPAVPPRNEETNPRRESSQAVRERDAVSHMMSALESLGDPVGEGDDVGWAIARNYSALRFSLGDRMSSELAKRIAIKAIIRHVLQLLGPVSLSTELTRTRFRPGADGDIDIDTTLENIVGSPKIEPEDIILEERQPKELAVALMLDASLSMTGEKLAMATAAISVLAHRLKTVDYLLITFNDVAKTVKRIESDTSLDELISDLLSFNASGYTNIDCALRHGARELAHAETKNRIGILITDGNFTVGPDPRESASAFRRLFVVMTSSHDCQPHVCEDLARNGGGRMYAVSRYDEIPRVLYMVLRMVSQGALSKS